MNNNRRFRIIEGFSSFQAETVTFTSHVTLGFTFVSIMVAKKRKK